ncbi:class I adenylate-forming enzyme family protein [Chelatococcus reniformis]|uniref:3-methylmercaptopropionyl-CoA ligase n=1 Tax=Chelatococcus reniformis TaxID=1494448 RepID=A0A916TWP8_9HYPH|nr:AMP-binding protein [Chelatococcus reniformis]GGC47805.1 acyl-CoA synthetase [Chelatococcus reniformis]
MEQGESLRPNVSRFADLIRIAARAAPQAAALVCDGRTWTYGELMERARRLAAGLPALGLKPGDAVGILSTNRPEYLEAYIGLQLAGLVAVPVNFRLAPAEVQYVLGNCEARGLIVEDQYSEAVEGLLAELPGLSGDAIVAIGEAAGGRLRYEELLARSTPLAEAAPLPPLAPAVIFYTSGTTGFPKGATMSHLNMLTRLSSWGWEFGLNREDVVLVPGPVFHGSFSGIALTTLAVGGTVILARDFDAAGAVELIEGHGITWSFLVPKMIELLTEALPPGAGRSLRGLLSSGSPLPQPLLDTILAKLPHVRLADAYGWTETGWLTICRHADLARGKRSVGRPGFGCEVAILGPDGKELGPGEVGEIHAANPVGFLGYHNNPEATKAARKGKWESGGDLGFMDEDGYLCLVDRKNDMIISGGENIYPAEIERVLAQHPGIMEVTVVGVPDEKWGESPRACVVLHPGEEANAHDIQSFCNGRLARYKHPRSVIFLEALPRNAMGKVLRRELRQRYAGEPRTTAA